MPGTEIDGDLIYSSSEDIFLDKSVKLDGQLVRKTVDAFSSWSTPTPTFTQIATVQSFFYVCAMLAALPFMALFPRFTGLAVRQLAALVGQPEHRRCCHLHRAARKSSPDAHRHTARHPAPVRLWHTDLSPPRCPWPSCWAASSFAGEDPSHSPACSPPCRWAFSYCSLREHFPVSGRPSSC